MHSETSLERAAELGAQKALQRLGLDYDGAADDIRDVRSFIGAWRVARNTAFKTAIRIVTAAALVAGFAWLGITIHRS